MAVEIETREIAPTPLVAIHATAVKDIGAQVGRWLGAVSASMRARGIAPVGPPIFRYHANGPDGFDLDAGFPIAAPADDDGDVKGVMLPGGRVATTWHVGPYSELTGTWMTFHDAILARGLKLRGMGWEVYWGNPDQTPNSADLRTELVWPVE